MYQFPQTVSAVGRITPDGVALLGTGFFVTADKVATTRHVIGNDDRGLCIVAPHIQDLDAYQDTTENSAKCAPATVADIDPHRDLAILQLGEKVQGRLPSLGALDSVGVGGQLAIIGFPHATDGRRVLTLQFAELGAKVLLSSANVKSKYGILNVQARPGQSGSMILDQRLGVVVAVLVGAYSPSGGGAIRIGNIDPRELHQTTHCICASYLSAMLR